MQFIIIIVLILLNAFFAASEIAFISLNDAKIDKMVLEGNKKARKIKEMLVNPSKFLATIQIGITLAGFLSSAFASESFASKLAPKLNELMPAISLSAWNSISIIVITIILSYFTLVFGELVPKRIAMKNCEKIAFFSIGIIGAISLITAPFVKLLTFSTNIVSKIFGVSEKDEKTVTEEEIRMMVDVGEEKGTIEEEEKNMINNVFEFNDKLASDVMVPRTEIFAVENKNTIADVVKILEEENNTYSRIPIYKENIDNIVGVVHVKDLFYSEKRGNTSITKIMKTPYYVPESKPIDEIFSELRKKRNLMAVVIDEYGGTSGIVTMEDILEEIVGEIYDEYDEVEELYEMVDDNTFILNGEIAIYDVEEILDIHIDEGEYDTLSGFLVEKLGRVPTGRDKNRTIETEEVIYKIEAVKDKHIVKVKACKVNKVKKDDNESKN
ncbi:MAG: HlyC/CorC family transporter [Clostridia bacterium]|nr:HlyC/CorC family transporter [Clostridia bacterium]